MYRISLMEAVMAAKFFSKRGDKILQEMEGNEVRIKRSKDSGNMVRASMELSRKLADLRNNR
jgi:hypothetical protein